jgi:hypothetical protein
MTPDVSRRVLGWTPIALVALCMVGVGINRAQGAWDNDLWWHLRLGSDFLAQGNLHPPHWSPFQNQSWVPTEPVPEVVAALAERWAGLNGVMWLYAAGCMVVVLALYVGNRAVGRPTAAMVGTLLATLGCSISLTPRPQLTSFVLLALVLRAWNRTADDLRPRGYVIPLVYGWSLCHGFWFIGVGYGFLVIAGLVLDRRLGVAQAGRLLLVATLAGASVLLNPVGIGVFLAPFQVNAIRQFGSEWAHTTPTMLAPVVVLLVQLAVLVLWSRHRELWSWRRVLMLASSVFWLWYAWRTVALAGVVVAPLFTETLERVLARSDVPAPDAPVPSAAAESVFVGAVAALCALALLVVVPVVYQPPPTDSAVDRALDRLPPGTVVFNEFDVGGYLVWRHPDLHPVIDGLITPYSPQYVADDFRALDAAPGWQRFVDASGARAALLLSRSRVTRLLEDDGWVTAARYNDYVVLRPAGAE